jgi:hypothetical protein
LRVILAVRDHVPRAAMWADDPFGPAELTDVLDAPGVVDEVRQIGHRIRLAQSRLESAGARMKSVAPGVGLYASGAVRGHPPGIPLERYREAPRSHGPGGFFSAAIGPLSMVSGLRAIPERRIATLRPAVPGRVDQVHGVGDRASPAQSNHSSAGSNGGTTTLRRVIRPTARCRTPGGIITAWPGPTGTHWPSSSMAAPASHSRM